jgi:hypothetical protein
MNMSGGREVQTKFSLCKGPEAKEYLVCMKDSKEISVVGTE